jgi:uncharacterized protein
MCSIHSLMLAPFQKVKWVGIMNAEIESTGLGRPPQTHVLYHDNCLDGMLAAWCVYHGLALSLEQLGHDGRTFHAGTVVAFHAVDYHRELPDLGEADTIYCVDFCPEPEVVQAWLDFPGRVVLLDHHASAVRKVVAGIDVDWRDPDGEGGVAIHSAHDKWIEFDQSRSGARLAWDHFCHHDWDDGAPHPAHPWFIIYGQDHDLGHNFHGTSTLPHSPAVSAYLHSFPFKLRSFFELLDKWQTQCKPHAAALLDNCTAVKVGGALLRQADTGVRTLVTYADHWLVADGRDGDCQVPVVNAASHTSALGHALVRHHDAPFSLTWHVKGPDLVKFNVRGHDDGPDCARIAELFGGGGHHNAAGFHLPLSEALIAVGTRKLARRPRPLRPQKGDLLTCVRDCLMDCGGQELTKGRSYVVCNGPGGDQFAVTDDSGDVHWFEDDTFLRPLDDVAALSGNLPTCEAK